GLAMDLLDQIRFQVLRACSDAAFRFGVRSPMTGPTVGRPLPLMLTARESVNAELRNDHLSQCLAERDEYLVVDRLRDDRTGLDRLHSVDGDACHRCLLRLEY